MMSAKDAHVVTGRRLSHYEVQEQLGAGGMGVVYAARDETLGRVAAIKVLPPEKAGDEARRRRFLREAKVWPSDRSGVR